MVTKVIMAGPLTQSPLPRQSAVGPTPAHQFLLGTLLSSHLQLLPVPGAQFFACLSHELYHVHVIACAWAARTARARIDVFMTSGETR